MSSPNHNGRLQARQEVELQNTNGEANDQSNPAADQDNGVAQTGGNQTNVQATPPPGDFSIVIARLEKRLQLLLKTAFVLMNLYYLFQGIVLTAVSQVSSPKCRQLYFFFPLSFIPFVLNGVPLIYVAYKYVKAKKQQDTYMLLQERSRDGRNCEQQVPEDEYRKGIYYFGLVSTACILVVFNGAVLYACYSLLCDHDPTLPKVDYDGECFRVCNDKSKCLKICTE